MGLGFNFLYFFIWVEGSWGLEHPNPYLILPVCKLSRKMRIWGGARDLKDQSKTPAPGLRAGDREGQGRALGREVLRDTGCVVWFGGNFQLSPCMLMLQWATLCVSWWLPGCCLDIQRSHQGLLHFTLHHWALQKCQSPRTQPWTSRHNATPMSPSFRLKSYGWDQ